MDTRVGLLSAFSRTFIPGVVKVEAERFGFPFLADLLAGGGELEYGQLTTCRLLHKYKLVNLPAARIEALLADHVAGALNVCRYFDPAVNDVFCLNLDNNHRTESTALIPEMTLAVDALRSCLAAAGCEPLVVASGRGFHVWGRLDSPVPNARLHDFMLRAAARALLAVHEAGRDHRELKVNFYPDVRIANVVSLRLFGSIHAKTRVFSHVTARDGTLLDEAASWRAFEEFISRQTLSSTAFEAAHRSLGGDGPASAT